MHICSFLALAYFGHDAVEKHKIVFFLVCVFLSVIPVWLCCGTMLALQDCPANGEWNIEPWTCQTSAGLLCRPSPELPSRAPLRCLIRLLGIQEESSALKYSQYYAFNSIPSGPQGGRARSRNGMQQHKDPFGMTEVSQDKSPLLNSCHDSLDNNLHYPVQPPGYT